MENQKQSDSQELADLKSKLVKYESMDKYQDDEIDLKALWNAIWLGKWKVIGITFVFAVVSVCYALSLPDIYKSEALLAPNTEDSSNGGLGALAGQFGGLASLAGMDLGGGGTDKVGFALEVLKSRKFLYKFIEDNDLKAPLIGVKSWDKENNQLIYNLEIYNPETKEWFQKPTAIKKSEPSLFETYEYILNILEVEQGGPSNMINISVAHYSPYFAKDLVSKLIIAINATIKEQDLEEATKSIKYLTEELLATNLTGMQTMFYQLIEQQQQTLMLAKIRTDYVLKTIDPPIVSEKKDGPKRSLICILGTFLGGVFSVLLILVRHTFRE
jgi:uncharacterized protein involved in exopolysaccharide biosynthesis